MDGLGIERVLVVEDDPLFQSLVQELMGAWSRFEVRTATTLAQAQDALAWQPSVILLDLNLPDSTGLDTVSAMLEAAATTPIIVMTGGGDTELGTQAVRRGAQDYLPKEELGDETLERALRFGLERRRLEIVKRHAIKKDAELRRMQDLDRAKGGFYAHLADTVNSLVHPLSVQLSLLDGKRLDRAGRETLSAVRTQIKDLGALTREFQEIAAIQRGTLTLDRKEFGIADALDLRLLVWEDRVRKNRLGIEAMLANATVHADRIRIINVMDRLVDNALQHTPAGGRIVLTVEALDDVVITLQDEGIGIPAEMLPHVFEAYLQPAERRTGRGLGLAICRGIIEAHGGTIEVTCDGGTTVTVTLPRVD